MIRLIFCDLDGTLLQKGTLSLPRATLDAIRANTDKGVLFCVSSGRPYDELKNLFGELYRRVIFSCLDGALVMHRDCVLYKNRLCKLEAARLASLSDKAVLYGRQKAVTVASTQPAVIRESAVHSLGGEIFKVALFGAPVKTAAARLCYDRDGIVEYVSPTADKGDAARVIMKKFGVTAAECAALGDGENDIPLLRAVAQPYRMAHCHPSLLPFGFTPVHDAAEWLSSFLKSK